jgi:oxygen-independent coproporphyrinogen III oxidase
MQEQILQKYIGQEAPRYTSYPTAPNFKEMVTQEDYFHWLDNLKEPISLYVHIPYCYKLCLFCGCNTMITNHYQPVSSYVDLLLQEISLLKPRVLASVSHMHFGGGSPTILNSTHFQQIFHSIKSFLSFTSDAEIAIEIDPRNFDAEKASIYAKLGINRASIGVQDFNLAVQKAINRVQPYEVVQHTFNLLRENNINNINVDLIYGLPLQTEASMIETANAILTLAPARISFFAYAHVTWKKKQQKTLEKHLFPTQEIILKMYARAKEIFENAGYVAIGMDHFALKSDNMVKALSNKSLKRNFQGYSVDNAEQMLGMGLSAIGKFSQGYVQTCANIEDYKNSLNQNMLPIARGYTFKADDLIRKEVIDHLMCYMQVDLGAIVKKYQLAEHYFSPEVERLAPFIADGLMTYFNQQINIISKYRMIVRSICAIFDRYFNTSKQQYSKVS